MRIRGFVLREEKELNTICAKLMMRRKLNRIKQVEIAKELGITQQAYSRKEMEGTFSLVEFLTVCRALELDPAEVMKEAIKR